MKILAVSDEAILERYSPEVLKEMFKNSDETIENIIFYILDKKRMENIRNITAEYLKIYYEKNQIVDVEATFAVEPSEAQKTKLIANLEKKTGKKVKLAIKVDKSILGGGIIRIGDTVIDGSIRKELENIKKR